MQRTIYEDMYEFKNKLSRSKFKIFIDGIDTSYVLDNDISEQLIRPVTSNSDEDALLVEEFIQQYDDTICALNNIQMYPSASKFVEMYIHATGLASACYVEELREIHIESTSMYVLANCNDEELKHIYMYISHINYKNMCLRYNMSMNHSNSMCGLLKKKFKGLIYLPCKFSWVELYTDNKLSEVVLDDSLASLGRLEILHRLPNGKLMSVDVKDDRRMCVAFHKNQLMQHFVGSDKDITKRDFLARDILYIDILHLLAFPDMIDLTGHILSIGSTHEFICGPERDVQPLIDEVAPNASNRVGTYLEFIYLRNNINYLDYKRFKQLVEELL